MAEIINVTYTSSGNVTFPLQMEKLVRIKNANFHKWAFRADVLKRRYGERVIRWGKDAASYTTTLYIGGPIEDRKELLEELHREFERDLRKGTPGRLTWGGNYIDCFVDASSTYPETSGFYYTVNEIDIYCPYPFWIEPKEYEFRVTESDAAVIGTAIVGTAVISEENADEAKNFLDYPHGYEYDYSSDQSGVQNVINDSPGAAPFKMVIYGPAVNPYFYIGDQLYIVYTSVLDGEYLTIDTLEKKVYRTTIGGTRINEFNNRGKNTSIFDPIPEGANKVIWPATFGMSLTLLKERSEPVWS